MQIKHAATLILCSLAVPTALAQQPATSIPITVDCNAGQSLNRTLAKLDKHTAFTVSVNGTCTEYVQVAGFEDLTLKGTPGATLLQPTTGPGNLFNSLLLIESSRNVIVQGLSIQADPSSVPAVGIGHGSRDVRLRNLTIEGGGFGILVFENSQVSIAQVTAKDPGYSSLGVYDVSDVHVEHCQFVNSTGNLWHAGMDVGTSHITMYATTIRNMQVGINAHAGSVIDIQFFNTYYPAAGSTDVVIENSKGTSFDGVTLDGGASLNVSGAKLVINKPGQPWGGTTGGIFASDGATVNVSNANLVISNSQSRGILVMNNSHATLAGGTVTGSQHGGLVVANLSSIAISSGTVLANVGGNSVDLFCDSKSLITGGANIAGAPTAQCANLLAGDSEPLP
jgi:Right handed beta helix region